MAEFSVTAQALKDKMEQLRTQNEHFKTMTNDLRDKEGILVTMWEGESRDMFHKEFQTSANSLDNFYIGINKYIQALAEIIEKYVQAEQRSTEIARTQSR
ncbi:MAG: WXG100 family type VII secretion target [Lachnospiraceae bacterium]|nr:WXG100 family type VII secretion target [Lachnospiraceae bacterium]